MSPLVLASLAAVGLLAGFVDAIAGGGGLLTLPALALAGLDPVAAVATNKLAGAFGSGSATYAFARAGRIEPAMAPSALAAAAAGAVGALALPFAPRALLSAALPVALVAVALYFAFAPRLGEARREARISPALYACVFAPAIGFYDGVFGPGAGSFYMIALIALVGYGLTRGVAAARLANFGSNAGALLVYALGGHIVVAAGLAMACGTFVGARIGAHATLRAGGRLARPLIVAVSIVMALKLLAQAGGPLESAWKSLVGG